MADPAEPGFLAWLLNKENSEVVRNYGVLLAALVGFPFLIWRTWATSRSAKAALKQAETATRHSVSDAFTRAIEQLGNQESLEVRLGGIYALERIARDSRRDHWPIMEVLTAFVREKAPLRSREETDGETKVEVQPPTTDIQAALTVLGRRKMEHEKGEERRLDLRRTNLSKANLRNACLERVDLPKSRLEGANLSYARLERASLWRAHLERANLRYAHLEGANFEGTHLEGADLTDATGLTSEQIELAVTDANTRLPEYLKAE